MKTTREELLKEISEDLVIYLKSGRLAPNTFLRELNLNIENLQQLLSIHFLMNENVRNFILNLPNKIRKFKTATKNKDVLLRGEVRGQINWPKTVKSRSNINYKDKTIYFCSERNKHYNIKENFILKEFIKVLYNILFKEINSEKLLKYEWFKDGMQIKSIIKSIYEKNIYLNKVESSKIKVTDRMIEDTIKSRNTLYSESAYLLKLYQKIINFKLNKEEVFKLLAETFIDVSDEDTLFELYWVIKLIKDNTQNEKMYVMDGKNSRVASWFDDKYKYEIYHDSTGSKDIVFQVLTDEIEGTNNEYIERKLKVINTTREIAKQVFKTDNAFNYLWSGRPDIIIQIRDRFSNKLVKIVLGEVKHTESKSYALQGLKELMEYIMLIKDAKGNYLYNENQNVVKVEGILFVDKIDLNTIESDIVKIVSIKDKNKIQFF